MNIPLVLHNLGNVIIILSGIMVAPLGIAIYYGTDYEIRSFTLSIITAVIVGLITRFSTRVKDSTLGIREGFGIVTFSWLLCALFGALPYWYAGVFPSFTDAYFEAVSGFTTTGASICNDVESLPHGILFWRNLTQWLGGMGIIVFFVAILPTLKVGGYQLFSAEVSGLKKDRIKPRIAETAKLLWLIYLSLSVLLAISLYLGGMPLFDTICHAFAAIATGGFSTKNASIAAYHSLYIEIVITVFMFLSACNFALYYQLVQGNIKKIFKNSESRFFLYLLSGTIILVATSLYLSEPSSYNGGIKDKEYFGFFGSLRQAAFQVVSIASTTGYASADFDRWPNLCRFLLIFLMFIGGCAGSTAGGIKNIRILIIIRYSLIELGRLIRPQIVKHIKIDEVSVEDDIIKHAFVFFAFYIGIFLVGFLVLLKLNIDVITAFSAVAATLGDVGPGLAGVGATKTYSDMPLLGKWVLIFCMVVGRLEMYGIFVLFLPVTWKR